MSAVAVNDMPGIMRAAAAIDNEATSHSVRSLNTSRMISLTAFPMRPPLMYKEINGPHPGGPIYINIIPVDNLIERREVSSGCSGF